LNPHSQGVAALSWTLAALDPATISYWPLVVLAVSIATVIVLISIVRMHAFLALVIAALVAGLFTQTGMLPGEAEGKSHWVQAIELVSVNLGNAAAGIAISIGLASIIGFCLMESGSADKVVRRFLAFFGEKRAGMALLWSTYILSVPIFFDTMFMLMVPIAKALRLRTGKDYMLFVMAICCGGVITHSMTIPHPGPIAAVANLKVDVGLSIVAGLMAGFPVAVAGWFVCKWINSRTELPLREVPGSTLDELKAIIDKPESELPSFVASMLPVILPIALISGASFLDVLVRSNPNTVNAFGGKESFASVKAVADFIGNKNIALLIGTFIAIAVYVNQCKLGWRDAFTKMNPALETAAIIILITSAGGAFGASLRNAGVGQTIAGIASAYSINLVVLSYFVALIIRVAQGSATVSMLTTSAMIYPMIEAGSPVHPVYIYLAIGFGAFGCSWMNDSGFWVVSRLGGLTERETLRSWTVLLTACSLAGLVVTLIASMILPKF
jgi:gluconate:H+ symporter, GntP family